MTFEDKLTIFMMIAAGFVALIIIIAVIDMLLDAKTKKVVEVIEKEKIIEKVVVKQAPVVNTVVATPQVACQATVKSVPSRPKPLITVEQGKSVVVSIDAKGNVMAGNNNTAVNVNLKK